MSPPPRPAAPAATSSPPLPAALAVQPRQLVDLLEEIRPAPEPDEHLLVSARKTAELHEED